MSKEELASGKKVTTEVPKEELKPIVKDDNISVPRSTFDQLTKRLDQLERDKDMLMQTADKRALARYYSRNQKDLPKRMKVRSLDGKVIVGWETLVDKGSFQIPGTGRWTEEQKVKLIFQDGESVDMDYLAYVRSYETIWCKRVGLTDEGGRITFKLIREDNGKEVLIDSTFVN